MSHGHPAVIPADVPGQKKNFGQALETLEKTSMWVRTYITGMRGRPPPPARGGSKTFWQKNFGLTFRSLSQGLRLRRRRMAGAITEQESGISKPLVKTRWLVTGALVPLPGLPRGRLRGAATNLRFKAL